MEGQRDPSQTTDWRDAVTAAVSDVLAAVKRDDPSAALTYLGGAIAAARIAELERLGVSVL